MVTNKKLYEMIAEQMNDSNDALREQLKSQIQSGTSETQTMAQELADRQRNEINALSESINSRLDALKNELASEISSTITNTSEVMQQTLIQNYDEKIEGLKSELSEKLDEQLEQIIYANKCLAQGIASLQKDMAVIMETLQLILTNMMLSKVETQFAERKNFAS